VVRHPLVQEVIRAYNHMDRQKKSDGRLKDETKRRR
jgi:phosphate starvation-inducible protein PhoH